MTWPITLPPAAGATCDVAAIGESSLDYVGMLGESSALDGGKHRLRGFHALPGGQAATAAAACARQGLRARYIGAFGDDEAGVAVRAALARMGVEVVAQISSGVPSRVAVILVDREGGRTVFEHRQPGLRVNLDDAERAALDTRILLVDATDVPASTDAARRARSVGIPTVVDVDRVAPGVDELLAEIAIVIVPRPFLLAFTGTESEGLALERLANACPRAAAVVVTLGEEGSLARAGAVEVRTPGFGGQMDVVDTTGAGDAFRGGFAAAWAKLGSAVPLSALLDHANATAALACREVGAQSALPMWDDVIALVGVAGTRPV